MADHLDKLTVCPNCNTPLLHHENYCPTCGQQNHELKLPLGHLVYEVVENITHFDDKLWLTLKAIFTRPGQITVDFLAGKRVRYVPPVRLYVFVSVIFFFLVGKSVEHQVEKGVEAYNEAVSDTTSKRLQIDLKSLIQNDSLLKVHQLYGLAGQVSIKSPFNEAGLAQMAKWLKNSTVRQRDSLLRKNEVSVNTANRTRLNELITLIPAQPLLASEVSLIGLATIKFKNEAERRTYEERVSQMTDAQIDSLIRTGSKEPGWFMRKLYRQSAKFANLFEGENADDLLHTVTKNLSVVMFVLMPFVAALLLFFYFRRGRYYYEHLIFSVHIHTVLFMLFSLALLITYFLDSQTTSSIMNFSLLLGWIYFFLSLKRVYGQTWFITTVKFLLLSLVYLFTAAMFTAGAIFVGMMTF